MPTYRLEYTKTSRGGCQATQCKKEGIKMDKGALKFGVWVEAKDNAFWSWRHWGCVVPTQLTNLKNAIDGDFDMLDGYEDLGDEDRVRVRQALADEHVAEEDAIGDNKPGAREAKAQAKEAEKETKRLAREQEKAEKKAAKEAEKETKRLAQTEEKRALKAAKASDKGEDSHMPKQARKKRTRADMEEVNDTKVSEDDAYVSTSARNISKVKAKDQGTEDKTPPEKRAKSATKKNVGNIKAEQGSTENASDGKLSTTRKKKDRKVAAPKDVQDENIPPVRRTSRNK